MSRGQRCEAEFVLTDTERAQLLGWAHGESARLAVRAKIVLACAEPGVVYERLCGCLAQAVRPSPVCRAGRWPAVGAAEGRAGGDRGRAGAADPVGAAAKTAQALAQRAKIVLACADG